MGNPVGDSGGGGVGCQEWGEVRRVRLAGGEGGLEAEPHGGDLKSEEKREDKEARGPGGGARGAEGSDKAGEAAEAGGDGKGDFGGGKLSGDDIRRGRGERAR